MTAILYQGIQRLQALQIEITNLLVFFKTIGQRVKFLVQKLRTEFLENVTDEDSLANHTWEDILKEVYITFCSKVGHTHNPLGDQRNRTSN